MDKANNEPQIWVRGTDIERGCREFLEMTAKFSIRADPLRAKVLEERKRVKGRSYGTRFGGSMLFFLAMNSEPGAAAQEQARQVQAIIDLALLADDGLVLVDKSTAAKLKIPVGFDEQYFYEAYAKLEAELNDLAGRPDYVEPKRETDLQRIGSMSFRGDYPYLRYAAAALTVGIAAFVIGILARSAISG